MAKIRTHFKRQMKFYNKHKKELLEKYLGKEIIIYRNRLKGVFDSFSDAVDYAVEKQFKPGKFMIKTVCKKEPVYEILTPFIEEKEFEKIKHQELTERG